MQTYDVVIAGGGPAGSSCAWRLRQAGLDVLVLDRASFPRDKPCAGWITPQVIDELALETADYRRGRTFQAITGFRIGVIGQQRAIDVSYGRPVSFAVRRCEFDHFLLFRSTARLGLGTGVASIRREGSDWLVNDSVRAPMLVGAGGHFCRVAAWLNGPVAHTPGPPLVVAQEAEVPIEAGFAAQPEIPEFYFAPDFGGYGWVCRKEQYLNVGFGHLANGNAVPAAVAGFVTWLEQQGRVPSSRRWPWRGHAYLLRNGRGRRLLGAGVLLAGDAAGLAYPQSGEGIRPAVESGLLAAQTIIEARGRYTESDLAPYEARLRARFAPATLSKTLAGLVPATIGQPVARALVGMPWFVRNVVIDRWFLHAAQPPLVA